MDPGMATCYLVCAACFGCGVRLLSLSADSRGLPASVAGALAVITSTVVVGLLGGPAGLLGWTTVMVGLGGCRWSRHPVTPNAGTGRDPFPVPARVMGASPTSSSTGAGEGTASTSGNASVRITLAAVDSFGPGGIPVRPARCSRSRTSSSISPDSSRQVDSGAAGIATTIRPGRCRRSAGRRPAGWPRSPDRRRRGRRQALEIEWRAVAAVDPLRTQQLPGLPFGDLLQPRRTDAQPADHVLVQDDDTAAGDRPHRELVLARDAEVAGQEHVERGPQRIRDLVGDRHAAARQREHDEIRANAVAGQRSGQHPPRATPILEQSIDDRSPPTS